MSIAYKNEFISLLTVSEVARLLRLSVGAVRNLITKKEIPALRLGKQYRIPQYVIENLLSPLLGESPEELGFGLWKEQGETEDSVATVNRMRGQEEKKSLEQILRDIREWERTSSSIRIS